MIAPEINELLAILMDTPGLKQKEIGPLLKKWRDTCKYWETQYEDQFYFDTVVDEMLEAWE